MSDPEKPLNEVASGRGKRRAPEIELKAEEPVTTTSAPEEQPIDAMAVPPLEDAKAAVVGGANADADVPAVASPGDDTTTAAQDPVTTRQDESIAVPIAEAETSAATQPPSSGRSMTTALAAAAVVGALFGGVGGYFSPALLGAGGGGDAQKLAAVERAQQDLARQIANSASATDLARLREQATALDAASAKRAADAAAPLGQRIAALEADFKTIAARPAPQPGAPPVDIAPLIERLNALQSAVAGLEGRVDASAKTAEAAGKAAEAAGKTADAAGKSAEAAVTAANPRIAALDQKIEQVIRRVEAGSAAPLFAAVQGVAQAFHRGAPYGDELSAAELLGAKPEQLAPLRPLADKGAPTPQRLGELLAPLAPRLAGVAEQPGVMGVVNRFVSIRPTGEAGGDTAPALVGSMEAALRRGDVAAALTAWQRLPEAARTLSAQWGSQAAERDRAAKALVALQAAAAAALRK